MDREAWREMAVVGIVARTRGRHGEVVVNPETDFPEERFRAGGTLFVERAGQPAAVTIREAWFQRGRPVLAFADMETVAEAERLRGAELRVPESELRALPADTWYEHELVGCSVRTVSGERVGTVGGVEGPAGAKRLIVRHEGRECDVPLVAEICVSVDTDAGSIVIDPPDGLLEVNRAASRRPRPNRRRRSRSPAADDPACRPGDAAAAAVAGLRGRPS